MPKGTKKKGGYKWPAAARKRPVEPLTLKDAYECGRIVFEHFEEMSNREIVEQEKLSITKLTLHRCCAAYRVLCNLGYTPENCPFGFGIAARLDLVEEKYQSGLAKRAVDEQLSTQELEFAIAELRQKHPRTAGKQPMLRFERALGRLEPFTDGHFNLLGDLDQAGAISDEKRAVLLARATQLRGELEKVEKSLAAAKSKAKPAKAAKKKAKKKTSKK